MALPKKGLRKISVDNILYAWNTTGNDGFINLSIIPIKKQDRLLKCTFEYHSKEISTSMTESGIEISHYIQQIQITNYIVRQVILFALNNGWSDKAKIMNLFDMNKKIDLRIEN